jgi:ribonuclease T2
MHSFTGSNNRFWSQEWRKHGLCSNFDMRTHFSLTLHIYRDHDVVEALRRDGIIPKQYSFYTLCKVVKVIKDAFGAEPTLVCR